METARLLLRNRTRALLTQICSQEKSVQMAFFGCKTEAELDQKMPRIKKRLENTQQDYRAFDLIEKENNQVIGSCGFHNWLKEHERAELGYELYPAFRRQGFMREAIQPLLTYGFTIMNLNRIEASIAPANIKSIQVVNHFGFTKEGILRAHYKKDGQFEDSVMYGLLKSDFIP